MTAMTGPRSFAAKCAAIMHEREPEALTEAEVRDGWGEQLIRQRLLLAA